VVGNGQFDPPPRIVESTSDVLWMTVFDPLVQEPIVYFEVGNHCGTSPLGNIYGIPDVITVAMRDKDIVGRDFIRFNWRQGIAAQEGIDE
jgi:hypothetical protein